jgi:hypothetical protein
VHEKRQRQSIEIGVMDREETETDKDKSLEFMSQTIERYETNPDEVLSTAISKNGIQF